MCSFRDNVRNVGAEDPGDACKTDMGLSAPPIFIEFNMAPNYLADKYACEYKSRCYKK